MADPTYNEQYAKLLARIEEFRSFAFTGFPANPAYLTIGKWSKVHGDQVPFCVLTGHVDFGQPSITKLFRRVRFFGYGDVSCIGFVDHHPVFRGKAEMSSNSERDRNINFPRGTKGAAVNLLFVVKGKLHGVEIDWDPAGEKT